MSKQTITQSKNPKSWRPLHREDFRATQEKVSYLEPFKVITRLFSPYWLACIPLAAIIVVVWHSAVAAQDTVEITVEGVSESVANLQGYLNTIWVLIAAILVIFMNAGFCMLEAGLCRQKNAVNILAKNLIVFALASIAYWVIGYSIMFGQGNPFIGGGGWFLSGTSETYGLSPFPVGLPVPVHFLFQVAFAGTAATIVSGAVAERIKFLDFLIFSLLLTGIFYPITGHWAWNAGGWLYTLGFRDFAGSTVVHLVGGCAALMGAFFLGPRIGKYNEGRINAMPGHNLSIATLGCLILWIGWFGFNPGSQLAVDQAVPYIAVTTNLAGAAGGIAATLTSWFKDGKPDLTMIINGILAGLVAVTAGCNVVSYWGAVVIGIVGGILVVYAVSFFDKIRIDDPVGALSVHLVNGAWGTLAVGIFADPTIPIAPEENAAAGLLFGNFGLIIIQVIGIVAVAAFTLILSAVAWMALKGTLGIRVTPDEEMEGLDVGEHGMEAYSGFVKEADILVGSRSGGMSGVDVHSGSQV